MSEFETTSLIVAGVGVAASIISAIAASVAAIGIWHGIRAMIRANKERGADARADRQAAEAADQRRHAEAMRRHDEAMQAGDQRHAEAMAALNELIQAGQRQHEATMRALERQGAALETVIERTAPKPAPGAPAE